MTHPFSADSHVVEPPEVFLGLEPQFGSRAPQLLRNDQGRRSTITLGGQAILVGQFGIAGRRLDEPATHELIDRGYDGLAPATYEPAARLRAQSVDGVVGEVLYPSINMLTFSLADRELAHALFRRHNDWIREYCNADPSRLVGIACLPLPDVDDAVTELHRVARAGARGVAIPCAAPGERPYNHPDYEPFWRAVEEAGLPVSLHIMTGASPTMDLPERWGSPVTSILGYTLSHAALAVTLGQLICGGVAERHPRLRVVAAEFETGWLAHFLQRLDHATYRCPEEASPDLMMTPSEYFRRQFFATFEDDETGVRTRDLIGVANLMWANDYPHHDSVWPRSPSVLNRIFAGVPADDRDQMTSANVRRLYGVTARA